MSERDRRHPLDVGGGVSPEERARISRVLRRGAPPVADPELIDRDGRDGWGACCAALVMWVPFLAGLVLGWIVWG